MLNYQSYFFSSCFYVLYIFYVFYFARFFIRHMPKIFAPSKNTKKITENRAEKESNLILIVHILVWQKNWDKSTFLFMCILATIGMGIFFYCTIQQIKQACTKRDEFSAFQKSRFCVVKNSFLFLYYINNC